MRWIFFLALAGFLLLWWGTEDEEYAGPVVLSAHAPPLAEPQFADTFRQFVSAGDPVDLDVPSTQLVYRSGHRAVESRLGNASLVPREVLAPSNADGNVVLGGSFD
jgi:hypothetical protein